MTKLHIALYPQTKRGGDRRSEDAKNQTAESAVWSFNKDTATKTGISERGIFVDIQIANDIAPAVKDIIRLSAFNMNKPNIFTPTKSNIKHCV